MPWLSGADSWAKRADPWYTSAIDSDREAWKNIWERFKDEAQAPWREQAAFHWAAELPRLTGADIARSAKTFRKSTGLGCDTLRPRWLCWLSGELLDVFARFLTAIEKLGRWPDLISVLLISQIPKADGGRRPIGLLPTLVRVWEKARKPCMEAWRLTVARSYNFAARGKSANTAVWLQAHHAEVAVSKGGYSTAVLLDLIKAFEMVKLELVWIASLRLHCPPLILRLELEAFAFTRRLVMMGVTTDPVQTPSSILAGGSFATDALYLVMIGICDKVLIENPGVTLCLFVDDLTIHATGGNKAEVTQVLNKATSECVHVMEEKLCLMVSRGRSGAKTVAVHSDLGWKGSGTDPRSRRRFAKSMGKLGIVVARQAKLLGVDFSGGKRVKRSVQRRRVIKICKRKSRYRQLGRKAASHVVKTGAGPGFRYGAAVYGATNTAIKTVRSFSCSALGEMRGKSIFARLTLSGYDAGALMATDPIVHWAVAVWDTLVSRDDMQCSWKNAMINVAGASRPFCQVSGPAGAMVASARRIGWQIPSPFHLLMGCGTMLNLHEVAPRDV